MYTQYTYWHVTSVNKKGVVPQDLPAMKLQFLWNIYEENKYWEIKTLISSAIMVTLCSSDLHK